MYQPEELAELLASPVIKFQEPNNLKEIGPIFDITCTCAKCTRTISEDKIRGKVFVFDNVTLVKAVGICHGCKKVTPFMYRVYDDYRIMMLKDGKWSTTKIDKSLKFKITSFLSSLTCFFFTGKRCSN